MNDQTFDLIIVGGGIAGGALAVAMSRAGAHVLVVEREVRFRDRVRGEWLAPWGVEEAHSLGLEPALVRAQAHALPFLAGRSGKPRPVRSPAATVPLTFSHPVLQESILASAIEAGAEVVRGAAVIGIAHGPGPAVTYRARGEQHIATARLVAGADGRSSMARAALGRVAQVHRSPRLLSGIRLSGLTGDPAIGYFVVREDIGGFVSLFPQGNGFGRAYVFAGDADLARFRGRDGFRRFIETAVDLGVPSAALANASAAGPLATFVADDTWVERPAERSLALIGDAAGSSDPTWGMGIALALRDSRTLATFLQKASDWDAAAAAYAAERDKCFTTIVTAENWQSDLQLAAGPDADRRRRHALSLWSKEPERALDLPGLGPGVDVSESARVRFFGEDVPMEAGQAVAGATPRTGGTPATPGKDLAASVIAAIEARDFASFRSHLSPSVRARMLLPGGPVEVHGGDATTSAFAGWFQNVDDFSVLQSGQDGIADRLRLFWRISLRWPGEPFNRIVEQTLYAKVVDERVAVIDLLCTGFRPWTSVLEPNSRREDVAA